VAVVAGEPPALLLATALEVLAAAVSVVAHPLPLLLLVKQEQLILAAEVAVVALGTQEHLLLAALAALA
jgi:hypothetical protein